MTTHPADLGVAEAAALLARRELSSAELVDACLARIAERDGEHSHEGDPGSVNAWVRVYEEDARAAAARADERLAAGEASPLCGVPLGLKDLYGVAGKPLTASSTLLRDVPERSCDVWARLEERGMVLLGHLHTHEFAAGGTTDQVGSPWALDRTAGGSSGGSGAALAARMVPAATGTDTAGSLRIPSALSGTSTIKPTRGLLSIAGIVPLAESLDHPGPMARSLADCALLLDAMAGAEPGPAPSPRGGSRPLEGVRLAPSPRIGLVDLEPDVAAGFDGALEVCRRLGATVVTAAPELPLNVLDDYFDVFGAEMLSWHRRFDGRRDGYRPAIREFVEAGEKRALPAEDYVAAQSRRRELAAAWDRWLAAERIDALIEPTVPETARLRGPGYDRMGSDFALISLTHYWNWTGAPVAALPAGTGANTGLPVGVSLIGPAGGERALLELGVELQAELGVPSPYRSGGPPKSVV